MIMSRGLLTNDYISTACGVDGLKNLFFIISFEISFYLWLIIIDSFYDGGGDDDGAKKQHIAFLDLMKFIRVRPSIKQEFKGNHSAR